MCWAAPLQAQDVSAPPPLCAEDFITDMRTCSYCGASYQDCVIQCPIDHTSLVPETVVPPLPPAADQAPQQIFYDFVPLSPEDRNNDLVTLVTCGTLISADMAVARLRAAGIPAFIPDENLVQAMAFNLNAVGYVRVQIAPNDHARARELLSQRAESC